MTVHKDKLLDFVLNGIPKTRILVVGDVMLDRYYYGEVSRISPEAPVTIIICPHAPFSSKHSAALHC